VETTAGRKSRRAKAQFRANHESKSAPRQAFGLELEIISRGGTDE
jgi:hypothetical protein